MRAYIKEVLQSSAQQHCLLVHCRLLPTGPLLLLPAISLIRTKTSNTSHPMNTHPQIIDPHRPTLPIMNTFEDAQRLDAAAGSDFHAAAFFFQGWIGNLLEFGTAQIAEIPDPQDRSFQNGQAWRS